MKVKGGGGQVFLGSWGERGRRGVVGEGVGSGQCNGEVKVGDTEIYGLGTLPAFNSW